jgi:hypothetical protein
MEALGMNHALATTPTEAVASFWTLRNPWAWLLIGGSVALAATVMALDWYGRP